MRGGGLAGRPRSRVGSFALTSLMWLAVAAFVIPLAWMAINSFRPTHEILTITGLSPALFVPTSVTLDNYVRLFASAFTPALMRSIIVAAAVTCWGLAVCVLAAFALSVLRFPYRNAIFAIVVISFVVPTDATAFALLRLTRQWGLENTYLGLILPVMIDGMVIFLLRQFFLGIPGEIVDSARVDGASWWTVLGRIYLPLSRPALIGGALILFITQWTAYLWPLLISNDPSMYLAPIALAQATHQGWLKTDVGVMFAGSVILTLVPVLALLPLQRYFVQSIAGSGLKG